MHFIAIERNWIGNLVWLRINPDIDVQPGERVQNSGLGAGKLQPELGALMQRAAEPAQAWPEGGCVSRGQCCDLSRLPTLR